MIGQFTKIKIAPRTERSGLAKGKISVLFMDKEIVEFRVESGSDHQEKSDPIPTENQPRKYDNNKGKMYCT